MRNSVGCHPTEFLAPHGTPRHLGPDLGSAREAKETQKYPTGAAISLGTKGTGALWLRPGAFGESQKPLLFLLKFNDAPNDLPGRQGVQGAARGARPRRAERAAPRTPGPRTPLGGQELVRLPASLTPGAPLGAAGTRVGDIRPLLRAFPEPSGRAGGGGGVQGGPRARARRKSELGVPNPQFVLRPPGRRWHTCLGYSPTFARAWKSNEIHVDPKLAVPGERLTPKPRRVVKHFGGNPLESLGAPWG